MTFNNFGVDAGLINTTGAMIGAVPDDTVGTDVGMNLGFWTLQSGVNSLSARMMILSNGNVGIATTSPQYKLSVNGTIQAKEVLVNTGWSDYVFDPHYRVKPLTEVAAFIKANHHLPDIPSEAEIKREGRQLGQHAGQAPGKD